MSINPDYKKFSNLDDPHEFDKRFIHKTEHMKHRRAYEETENEYKACFGKRKYKSFSSYFQTYLKRATNEIT